MNARPSWVFFVCNYMYMISATSLPFRIEFNSDQLEITGAMLEAVGGSPGFKIRYYHDQTSC